MTQQQINETPNGLKVGDLVRFRGKSDGPYKVDSISPANGVDGLWITVTGPLGVYGATDEELEPYHR